MQGLLQTLSIGQTAEGAVFELPEEALVETFFFGGIRGSGKTTAVAVMCEEFCRIGLPWIMLDPVSVGWGLRAGKDGNPKGGLPVVVFGGAYGDLPLEKGDGAKIAEAVIESNICAVIDLKLESKNTWRKFITDFSLKLLEVTPKTPRHIFIEEAGELLPQKAKFNITAQCKEAVERLVRLGRNQGYGCSLVNQRPATIDKDVLSQVGNLFLLRTIGKHDRKACMEWLEPKFEGKAREEASRLVNGLATLPDGSGYFWSPSWLRTFKKIQFRDRNTFHPGATRRDMRGGLESVELMPVASFVEKMKSILSKKQVSLPKNAVTVPNTEESRQIARLEGEVADLHTQLREMRRKAEEAEKRLLAVRNHLRPQYEILSALFSEIVQASGSVMDRSIYEPWLKQAGVAGCRRLLEILIERGSVTQQQLSTLSGIPINSTFHRYRAWLKRNGLVRLEGEGPQGTVHLIGV